MKKRFFSFTLALVLTLFLLPVSVFAADPKPVKINNNITLSDVVVTDEYETALELFGADGSPAAYEFLYNLGDVGFWQDAIEEYGYSTFWCYLIPENATITFHATQEMPRCDINVYTLEEVNGWSTSYRGWQATFIDGFNATLEPGKSEADYPITKAFIEGYDPKFDLLEIIMGNESILIWFVGPSASTPAFTDVPTGVWYADPVAWAVSKDITNGTGNGKFSPGQNCTHAQILTFLYRADRGQGKAEAADMDKAVAWARQKGMIGAGFDGSKPCTRADAVNYIWQAFNKPTAKTSSFTDVPASAAYAKAVDWAVEKGITKGDGSEDTFAPDKVCTRGHIVTFLYRAYNN